jgi:hypothetical protein
MTRPFVPMQVVSGTGTQQAYNVPAGILCPELYALLMQRFGSVKIASHGEPFIPAAWMPDPRSGRLRPLLSSAGEYYRVSCPYCNDTKYRLWVNHMFSRIGPDNRQMTYLAHCYNEDCLAKFENRTAFVEAVLGFRNVSERRQLHVNQATMEPAELRAAKLPDYTIPLLDLPHDHQAVQYLCGTRRYTAAMIHKYGVCFANGIDARYPPAFGRIIFPIYFNQQLVGWQGRYPSDEVNWSGSGIAKYYTLPGFRKTQALYNFDVAKHKEFVVVCEGVTDVHAGGDHFVAVFGKNCHFHQRMLLNSLDRSKTVIFLLDPDAREEMDGIVASFTEGIAARAVLPIYLPDGFDPGDYDRYALWNFITVEAAKRGLQLRFTS